MLFIYQDRLAYLFILLVVHLCHDTKIFKFFTIFMFFAARFTSYELNYHYALCISF